MGINYYFIDNTGKQVGPLSLEEVKKRGITNKTLVWQEGMPNWLPAGSLPELNMLFSKTKQINTIRILLIVYAVIASMILLFPGKFISAFLASCFDMHPSMPALVTLVTGILMLIFFFFHKKRKYLCNTTLILLPVLVSTLFAFTYYSINYSSKYRFGRCTIEKSTGCGVLNNFGLEIIPCIYERLSPHDPREKPIFYYATMAGRKGIVDPQGAEIIPCEYDYATRWGTSSRFLVSSDNRQGLYSMHGESIIPCEYEEISKWRKTSLISVYRDDMQGLYSEDGEVILNCQYTICTPNDKGYSKINQGGYMDDDTVRSGLWGYIDKNGKTIVPCIYESVALYFSTGNIEARHGNRVDYYSLNGNYLRTDYKW